MASAKEFCVALQDGDLATVRCLVETGDINPHKKDRFGGTAFHASACYGYVQIVEYLVDVHKMDPNAKDFKGQTALHRAAQSGWLHVVEYLVEVQQMQVNQTADDGWTALHFAARQGHLNIVEYLVEVMKVDASAQTNCGWNTLHLAAYEGHVEVVRYLVEVQKVVAEASREFGRTALQLAVENGHMETAKYLVQVGKAHVDCKVLHLSAQRDDLESLIYLVEVGKANVHGRDSAGRTVLHFAAQCCGLSVFKYLVETVGVSVDVKTNNGSTVLHFAAKNSHLSKGADVVEYVVKSNKVEVDAKDKNGCTALHMAVQSNNLLAVHYLHVIGGVDLDATTCQGETALQMAHRRSFRDVARYLSKVRRGLTSDTQGHAPSSLTSQHPNATLTKCQSVSSNNMNEKHSSCSDSRGFLNQEEQLRATSESRTSCAQVPVRLADAKTMEEVRSAIPDPAGSTVLTPLTAGPPSSPKTPPQTAPGKPVDHAQAATLEAKGAEASHAFVGINPSISTGLDEQGLLATENMDLAARFREAEKKLHAQMSSVSISVREAMEKLRVLIDPLMKDDVAGQVASHLGTLKDAERLIGLRALTEVGELDKKTELIAQRNLAREAYIKDCKRLLEALTKARQICTEDSVTEVTKQSLAELIGDDSAIAKGLARATKKRKEMESSSSSAAAAFRGDIAAMGSNNELNGK